MSKYFHIEDDKVKDFKFKPFYRSHSKPNKPDWEFYIDDLHIGRISPGLRSGYIPVNFANRFPFVPRPFITRLDAAIFMLDWRRHCRGEE